MWSDQAFSTTQIYSKFFREDQKQNKDKKTKVIWTELNIKLLTVKHCQWGRFCALLKHEAHGVCSNQLPIQMCMCVCV